MSDPQRAAAAVWLYVFGAVVLSADFMLCHAGRRFSAVADNKVF